MSSSGWDISGYRFLIFCIVLVFAVPALEAVESTDEDSLAFFIEPEEEDTSAVSFIQPVPKEYAWLFPNDKKSVDAWKNDSRHFILPIDISMCYITDRGRFRSHRVNTIIPHTGIDCYANDSTDVLAAMAGRVTYVGNIGAKGKGKAFGWTIVIGHTNWLGCSNNYYSMYAHLSNKSICVKQGETVAQGQIIAKVGNSGNAGGYPPQVHFEIRRTKDPCFAQIRLSNTACKMKVHLLDPEEIYKREQLFVLIRNTDTKENLGYLTAKLADELKDNDILRAYVDQVGERLSKTGYPVTLLQYLIAAHADGDGTVPKGVGNHYAARTIAEQTKSFAYYTPNTVPHAGYPAQYFENTINSLQKSKFGKYLKVVFNVGTLDGVRLLYARSNGQKRCLYYQYGRIVDRVETDPVLPDIGLYHDVAVAEFGDMQALYAYDEAAYTRLVVQMQNLIGYWARTRDVVLFAGSGGIHCAAEYNATVREPSPAEGVFVVPGIYINRLLAMIESKGHDAHKELSGIVLQNKDALYSLREAYRERSKKLVQSFDSRLQGKTYTLECLDSLWMRLDSFVTMDILDSVQAGKRYAIINRFGEQAVYAVNDGIWDALDAGNYDAAMGLFIKNSKHFLRYSEEQYAKVFKRLEDDERLKRNDFQTRLADMGKRDTAGSSADARTVVSDTSRLSFEDFACDSTAR